MCRTPCRFEHVRSKQGCGRLYCWNIIMRMRWLAKLLLWGLTPPEREPDFVIGDRYLLRWFLIPRNNYLNVYLHHFLHSDDDRALHDHPYWSISLCLWGSSIEHLAAGRSRTIRQGSIVLRSAAASHRIELRDGTDCWTLFVTGPRIREWGFYCPRGWRHWRDYTKPSSSGQVGRGCGEL